MNNKKKILSLSLVASLIPIGATLVKQKVIFSLTKSDEIKYTIALDSSTPISDKCDSLTYRNTSFEIKDGYKKSGYLLSLKRKTNGNNNGGEAYIQNVTPITGLTSLSITYYGTYLTLFGADEGSSNVTSPSYVPTVGEFYRVKTFGNNTIGVHQIDTTALNDYLYIKIASGRQYANSETYITSIEYNYSCLGDYSSERSDLTNNASQAEFDEIEKSNIHPSDRSMKITDSSLYYMSFRNIYEAEELDHYFLSLDIKTTSNTATHIPFWMQFGDYVQNGNNGPWTISSFINNSWETFTIGLSELLSDYELAQDINYVYFKWNDWGESIPLFLDNAHVVEKSSYPAITEEDGDIGMDDSLDENDLSNLTFMKAWGSANDEGFDGNFYVTETKESRKISQSKSYQPFNFSLQEYDMQGCTLSFALYVDGDLGVNSFGITLAYFYDRHIYRTPNLLNSSSGISSNEIINPLDHHNGWKSISIDFDVAVNNSTLYDNASYIGFSMGRYSLAYIDNMTLEGFNKPNYSGSTFKNAEALLNEISTGWNLGNDLDNIVGCNSYEEWVSFGKPKVSIYEQESRSSNFPATQRIIDKIASLGFNAIRIPITWFQHMDEDDLVEERFLYRVKEVVDYCMRHNLITIINTHHDDGMHGWLRAMNDDYSVHNGLTKTDMNNKFKKLWSQIATYFKDYDYHLIFEGQNETLNINDEWINPTESELNHVNQLNQLFVNTVRKTGGNNKYRVLICSTYAAGANTVPLEGFVMPEDTIANRLIAEVHSYAPHSYTDSQDSEEQYTTEMREELSSMWSRINSKFINSNIPIIVGEYGAKLPLDSSDTSRNDWLRDYISLGQYYGVKMFHWDSGGEYRIIRRNESSFNVTEYNESYNGTLLSYF